MTLGRKTDSSEKWIFLSLSLKLCIPAEQHPLLSSYWIYHQLQRLGNMIYQGKSLHSHTTSFQRPSGYNLSIYHACAQTLAFFSWIFSIST